jgi:hypothetical protein
VNSMTLNVRRGRRGVGVTKLCIDIPDSLADWLREIAKEMATTPEAFMEQLLWQYHSVGEATLRAQCKQSQVKSSV